MSFDGMNGRGYRRGSPGGKARSRRGFPVGQNLLGGTGLRTLGSPEIGSEFGCLSEAFLSAAGRVFSSPQGLFLRVVVCDPADAFPEVGPAASFLAFSFMLIAPMEAQE